MSWGGDIKDGTDLFGCQRKCSQPWKALKRFGFQRLRIQEGLGEFGDLASYTMHKVGCIMF